jgi:hypothetical protein
MPDPTPLPLEVLRPAAAPSADRDFHLWRDAPGWRNLTLAAIGLSAALIALPLVAAPAADQINANIASCQGNAAAFAGPSGRGEVVGFLTPDQALKLLQNTQFSSRMAINPDFLANVRSLVHLQGSLEGARTIYLVPQGTNVRIGDHVEVVGGHVDPNLPCHYIPNLIVRVQSAG